MFYYSDIYNCQEQEIQIRLRNISRIFIDGGLDTHDQARRRRGTPNVDPGDDIEGRVEICYQNVWSAIYDENWSNKDAAVACYQLGFSRYGMFFM